MLQPPQTAESCPLCGSQDLYPLPCRTPLYHRCNACELVHLDPAQRLAEEAEKAIYDTHQNAVDDQGYRRFLSRALEQVLRHVPAPAEGLDFGCGPGPALVAMAREAGYEMSLYDKYYHPDPAPLQQRYDFITCTEVVEHLAEPLSILDQLWGLLRPEGVLVVQTKRVLDDERFRNWHYRNDPTHITFFSETALLWLARRWAAEVSFPASDVVTFRHRADQPAPL